MLVELARVLPKSWQNIENWHHSVLNFTKSSIWRQNWMHCADHIKTFYFRITAERFRKYFTNQTSSRYTGFSRDYQSYLLLQFDEALKEPQDKSITKTCCLPAPTAETKFLQEFYQYFGSQKRKDRNVCSHVSLHTS